MPRGGKRAGAGRKSKFNGLSAKAIWLPAQFEKELVAYAEKLSGIQNASDIEAFTEAYQAVGRPYVEIYKLRSSLGWTVDRFNDVLEELTIDDVIVLQGGDPSSITDEQIKDSYMDGGNLRIAVGWVHD